MASRIYLWISTAIFIGLAVALLFWPATILAAVDLHFETPTALSDIRADYGGCLLGVGIFLLYCSVNRDLTRIGLLCVGLTLLGYASGRLLSMMLDGIPKQIIFMLLTFEVVGGSLALLISRGAQSTPGIESPTSKTESA